VKINPKPFTKLNLIIRVISLPITKEINIEKSKYNQLIRIEEELGKKARMNKIN